MRTRGVISFSSITSVGLMLVCQPSPAVYQLLWVYSASLVPLLGAPRAATSYVGLACLAGLPPTAGFFGKAWVFWNASARHSFWLVLLAVASALLSTVYSLRLVRCTPVVAKTGFSPLSTSATLALAGHGPTAALDGRTAGAAEAACAVLLLFGPSLIVKPLADASQLAFRTARF
jgi:NADH:ubiquinone oxidoreductase subunit 2 (subunit N)